jgi:hypothetical protein
LLGVETSRYAPRAKPKKAAPQQLEDNAERIAASRKMLDPA